MIEKEKNDKPIWQLSIDDFRKILREEFEKFLHENSNWNEEKNEKKYIYGLSGIAQLLNCSIPTACRIKRSGILDEAITQLGRKIMVDSNLALSIIKVKKEKENGKKYGKLN